MEWNYRTVCRTWIRFWKLRGFCSLLFLWSLRPLILDHQRRSFRLVLAGWGLHGKSSWAAGRGETQHRHGCFEIEAGRSIDNMSNTFEHIVYIRYNVKTCQICEWKSWTWEEDVGLWRMMWNYVEFAPFARDKESPCSISHVGPQSSYTVGCCADWMRIDYMLI